LQWTAQLIALLWEFSFSVWNERNSILHEKQENHPDIDPDQIDLTISEEWTIGPEPGWDHGSRSLFVGLSCEELLAKPLHHRRQWLHYVHVARDTSLSFPFTEN
jgi:hypothetical protein